MSPDLMPHPAEPGSSDATPPVLSIRDLTTSFRTAQGWVDTVRNISFDVHAGETVAVVGESGSGKSVTALSTMRLLPDRIARSRGQILLGGHDLLRLPEAEMRRVRGGEIGMIFQEPMTSLNPVFTVGNQLAEALVLHRDMSWAEAEAEALRLMERVRIPSAKTRLHEYPNKFSGGMRQRVMIAMALACQPKLLIADEPTTALDVTIQAEILQLIRELQQSERMGVLFITHDMGVVAEVADRTVVMYRGDMIETGRTDQIFAAPAQPYTRALLASIPRLGSMRGSDVPRHFPQVDPETGAVTEGREMLPPATASARASATDASPAPKPAAIIDHLTVRFDLPQGRIHAVEDVSFTIAPGETLALVGESGCGKSTIGRTIMGLGRATSGTVEIAGQCLADTRGADLRSLRRRMQMIFQDPFASLNPRIRVGDAILEPILSHGLMRKAEARSHVAELLEKVGLSQAIAQRFPHEFSGGQRQRISIARALALNPNFIIADEAVSALDVTVKAQIANLMMDIQAERGLAYLFISHDMAVVERIAHRVAVMYFGQIVEIGSRSDIFSNPQHPYTRRLIDAVPLPDPSLRGTRKPAAPTEARSPIRPFDYVHVPPVYREVAPGHLVQTAETAAPDHKGGTGRRGKL